MDCTVFINAGVGGRPCDGMQPFRQRCSRLFQVPLKSLAKNCAGIRANQGCARTNGIEPNKNSPGLKRMLWYSVRYSLPAVCADLGLIGSRATCAAWWRRLCLAMSNTSSSQPFRLNSTQAFQHQQYYRVLLLFLLIIFFR